jgi:parvulin-like peptidyl-prolyl isomerase
VRVHGSGWFWFLVIPVGLSFPGFADEVSVQDSPALRPIAMVNGDPIVLEDLLAHLQDIHSMQAVAEREDFDFDQAMFRLVNDRLLAREARILEMDQEQPTKGRVERFLRKTMIAVLVREEIEVRSRATDEEVREFFEDRYQKVTLQMTTVETREEVDGLLAEIQDGVDMAEVARARSLDPYGAEGGWLRDFQKRDIVPEIGDLLPGMSPGELGGPVLTEWGWTVFRLDAVGPADAGLLTPELESYLHQVVGSRKAETLKRGLTAEFEGKYPIRLNQQVIDSIQPERMPDGRLTAREPDPDAEVARVGEDLRITAGQYGRALRTRFSVTRSEEAARAAAPFVLDKLVEQELLFAEARDRGYGERPEVVRAVRRYETGLLVQRFLQEVVAADIQVTQEEMEEYYESHKDSFRKPPRLRVGQITVKTLEEANEVIRMLRQGTDLAWLARQRSIDRLAPSGGDRGWMVPQPGQGGWPGKLANARKGDVLGPIPEPKQYRVWQVLAVQEQGRYSFREVSGNVREAVFSEKFRRALDDFITKLRARSEIEIFEEGLAPLVGMPPGVAVTPAAASENMPDRDPETPPESVSKE